MSLFDDLMELASDDLIDVDRTKWSSAPFGYTGGKSRLVPKIIPLLPVRHTWVEVFGGSGVVSWNREQSPLMVYNDRYGGVVNFYKCLRDREMMSNMLAYLRTMHPLSRQDWIECHDTWCTETDPIARAAKWFYMLQNSVINKGDCFARATGSKAPITLPNALKKFQPVHWKLQEFQLENLDWRVCIKDYDSIETVFYLDPPYVQTTAGVYEKGFTREDLQELLRMIRDCEGYVALSHYPNADIDACDFWTNRYDWTVAVHADVNSYTEQNYKKDHPVEKKHERSTEVLWVKEID